LRADSRQFRFQSFEQRFWIADRAGLETEPRKMWEHDAIA